MKGFLFLVALCGITFCEAITVNEIEYFGSTGMPEKNTGIVGYVTVTSNGNRWTFESNGVPDHDTGAFPGINPNSIVAGSNVYNVPKNPSVASSPSCLPGGPVAMAVNGVMIYNPWDADGDNAVEGEGAEIFDQCDGHPDMRGTYHYHKMPSSCLFDIVEGEASPLIGVAFDGFAIYGPNDENGRRLTSADLDECHGRLNSEGVYQYHTTSDFPYILGCYKGTPVRTGGQKCYSASDANSDGNVISTQTGDEGDDEGQARPPPPSPNGRPRGERIGVRHHRPIGQDNRRSRTDGRLAGNQGQTHYRPYRGPPRDRRDVDEEEANLKRVRRVQPMLPANLFQRRLPSGYKEWLSDIVFNRT